MNEMNPASLAHGPVWWSVVLGVVALAVVGVMLLLLRQAGREGAVRRWAPVEPMAPSSRARPRPGRSSSRRRAGSGVVTPAITAVRLSSSPRRAELPLVVLGAVPGIAATDLWAACARGLGDRVDLLAWDLPGQGHNTAVPEEPYSLAELAVGVLRVVDDVLEQRGSAGGSFGYVGGAVGGAVGLRLLLDAPGRIGGLVLLGGDDLLAEVDDPHLLQVAEEVGPLAPAEDPAATAGLIRRLLLGDEPAEESPLSERERALVLLAAGLVRGDAAPEHGLDTASAAAVRALLAPPSTGGG